MVYPPDSMKIYTKGGDRGETSLVGGVRVPKDAHRIQVYGTLDELNALLGMSLASQGLSETLKASFLRIQAELFQLGAELATPSGKKIKNALVDDSHVVLLEQEIDRMESELPPLKNFILPGGTIESSWVHLARTVSRRAERELVTLHHHEQVREEALRYVNRLSDFFFVAARYLNFIQGVSDIPWIAPSPKRSSEAGNPSSGE